MANISDHYPETLRDMYDKLNETLVNLEAMSATVDIALYVTEWIRTNWSGRTLIPSWWEPSSPPVSDADQELPGVEVVSDPVRTRRGRELRLVAWEIMALQGLPRSCEVAEALAARVEAEWSRVQVYVPKAPAVDRAIRDAAVWRDFSGFSTIGKVVQAYNLSQSVIYDIARRVQKDKDAREQPGLPGF
ncbi:MAG: Mor transcription activator family protein [Pseudomonadota bacterium]